MKWLFVLLLVATAIAIKIPLDVEQAHRDADGIYEPRFRAAYNEWGVNHREPAETDQKHFGTVNAKLIVKDQERWKAVRAAFKDLDQAMKQAGY